MKRLPRIIYAILLLSVTSLGWATCPEGQEENDRTGECEPIKGSAKAKKSLSSGSGWNFRPSLPRGLKKYSHQLVSAPNHPVRYGKKSERFEVRPGDCTKSRWYPKGWNDCKTDRERSELEQIKHKNCSVPYCGPWQRQGDEYWYRWSLYIPEGHQNIFRTKLAYGQFHQFRIKPMGGCPPAFMFQEYGGGYWLNIQPTILGYDDNYRLLEVDKFVGKWNDIVVHARWSGGNDGWFSVWVNGDPKVDYHGKTMACQGVASSNIDVYFKYGVYRSFMSRSSKSKTVTTIAYYDGVVRSKSRDGMFDPLPE